MEKIILLGASRGLGWETYKKLCIRYPDAEFLIASRKAEQRGGTVNSRTQLLTQDFSKAPVGENFIQSLSSFSADLLVYFAGGGPYGLFQSKNWASHQWCIQTSFLYPAELLHQIMAQPQQWASLKKVVLIGSSVAEAKADPQAASYAAAKHALKGLVESINAEQSPRPFVGLFSPPYMQTDLLPAHSHPRLQDRAEDPAVVADRLIEYIEKA